MPQLYFNTKTFAQFAQKSYGMIKFHFNMKVLTIILFIYYFYYSKMNTQKGRRVNREKPISFFYLVDANFSQNTNENTYKLGQTKKMKPLSLDMTRSII